MKIKVRDDLAWYFKHNDVTPRFQHVNICSTEFEYDTDPKFLSGDSVVHDMQEYANVIKAHIQSLDAQLRMDKPFYDRYMLHNTDEIPTQAEGERRDPNPKGTSSASSSSPARGGKEVKFWDNGDVRLWKGTNLYFVGESVVCPLCHEEGHETVLKPEQEQYCVSAWMGAGLCREHQNQWKANSYKRDNVDTAKQERLNEIKKRLLIVDDEWTEKGWRRENHENTRKGG